MTVTVASFRNNYPEFADSVRFSVSQIGYYLNLAGLLLNAARWNNLLDAGTELFVAHNLAIESLTQAEAKSKGVPGITTGPVSAKSVDKVSISYATSDAVQAGAGHWNLTVYGTRYVRLMRMFGAGPVQVGVGAYPLLNGPAWPGPQDQTSY
jgi:hypothetical protein